MGPGSRPGRLEKWIAFALPLPLLEQRQSRRRGQLKDQILIRFVSVIIGLIIGAAPAVAEVEQCRFIQAKPEREACYQRQAIALAAKRKPEPTADTRTLETLQQ
jgi:hypothetical protein